MHFAPFANTLATALLFLISTPHVHASPISSDAKPITTSLDDLQCPRGYSPTFLHNSYTYNAPLSKFTDITKSFFAIQWYPYADSKGGATVTGTAGTDNVPGATRAGVFGGAPFNETLTAYSTRSDGMAYTMHGIMPLSIAVGNPRPLRVASYAETKRFQSICGGKATYIDLITWLCSDDQITAYSAFYNTHMSTVQNLAATIGTTVLAGDCNVRLYTAPY
ncbi:hypothetical protein DFH09DRAFT_1281536 [Mycena vulgaris]|nr:hypothetical protein DFH09DRAFT_1281536 [Mycena vulgaris]